MKKILFILFAIPLIASQKNYLIISDNDKYEDALFILKNLYSNEISELGADLVMNVEILDIEKFGFNTIDSNLEKFCKIKTYLTQNIYYQIDYLLLFGDENLIPPLKSIDNNADTFSLSPSDDFYLINTDNSYQNIDESSCHCCSQSIVQSNLPAIGRLPVSSTIDANIIVEKIRNYTLNLPSGNWKSKVSLIADNFTKIDGNLNYHDDDIWHTAYTDSIYKKIKSNLNTETIYGYNYPLQTNPELSQDELSNKIIQIINSGSAIINYVGHGDTDTWADEKILDKDKHLNLINVDQKKLAIWIAGTCQFGMYDNESTSFAEKLLFIESGAISVISSVRNINQIINFFFLDFLFDEINDFVNTNIEDQGAIRLGDIFSRSKTLLSEKIANLPDNWSTGVKIDQHHLHLLGDPALLLPLPSKYNGPIFEDLNQISIMDINKLEITPSFNITENRINNLSIINSDYKDYEVQYLINNSNNNYVEGYVLPNEDNNSFILNSGNVILNTNFENQDVCFFLPIDVANCEECNVNLYTHIETDNSRSSYINIVKDINLTTMSTTFSDEDSPEISVYQQGFEVQSNSSIYKEIPILVLVKDFSGLNTLNGIGHSSRYWFTNSNDYYFNTNSLLSSSSICNNQENQIELELYIPNEIKSGENTLNIEIWDAFNNKNQKSISLNIISPIDSFIEDVYNVPNPMKDITYFTFKSYKSFNQIEVEIYNQMGQKIYSNLIIENFEPGFNSSLSWDGKDNNSNKLANGTYIYKLKVKSNLYSNTFENVGKLVILK